MTAEISTAENVLNSTIFSNAQEITTNVTLSAECVWQLPVVEWIKLWMLCAGMVGNGLTVLVILCNKSFHTITYTMIGMIAFADFLYCTSSMLWIVFIIGYLDLSQFRFFVQCVNDVFYKFMNTFVAGLISTAYLVSVLNVAALTVFRYILIAYPLKASIVLNKRIVVLTLIILVVVSCLNTVWNFESKDLSYTASNIVNMVVMYTIPLIVITIFHILKIVSLKKSQFQSENMKKQVKKMEKLVSGIILTFALLPLPWQILRVLQITTGYKANYILQTISGLSLQLNNCINPIFYALLSPNVRQKVIQLCCCSLKPVLNQGKRHFQTYGMDSDRQCSMNGTGLYTLNSSAT